MITTSVKVLSITDPIFVSGGKKKRDVIVGDRTGTAKVTLWEYSLHQNEGYMLKTLWYENTPAKSICLCLVGLRDDFDRRCRRSDATYVDY